MFDTDQARARSRPRRGAMVLAGRSFAAERARFPSLRTVGRRLNRPIRRAVLACLLWRVVEYRVRRRTDFLRGDST
jgi:hypothetical protein